MLARTKEGGLFYAPARDIGHQFPILFREVAVVLQEALETPEEIQALDQLTKAFIEMYADCMQDRSEGILRYTGILDRAETDPVFGKVFRMHADVLQFMLFVLMFSSRDYPQESTPLTAENLSTASALGFLLGNATVEERRVALDRWKSEGFIPEQFETGYLRRSVLDKVQKIAQQEAKYAAEASGD